VHNQWILRFVVWGVGMKVGPLIGLSGGFPCSGCQLLVQMLSCRVYPLPSSPVLGTGSDKIWCHPVPSLSVVRRYYFKVQKATLSITRTSYKDTLKDTQVLQEPLHVVYRCNGSVKSFKCFVCLLEVFVQEVRDTSWTRTER
jgi:hypothetical protein